MPSSAGVLSRAVIGQRRPLSVAALLAASHQAGEALVPIVIGVVIDRAVAGSGAGSLVRWLVVLGVVFAVLSYSFRFGARAGVRAAETAAHEARLALTERVLAPRAGAEAGRLPGALASLATSDAERVGSLNRALPYGLAAFAGLLVTAVALLRISVPLGLLVLLGTPPLLWLAHLLGKPLERRSGNERERAAHAAGIAADLVSGLRVLKGLGAVPVAVGRYRRTSREALTATVRASWAQAWHDGGMLALNGLFLALIALVGGRLAADGQITVGELVAAVGLAQYLIGPLTLFSWVNAEFAQARASATRIAEVLAAPPAVHGGTGLLPRPVRGGLRLRGLSHAGLRDLDLDVPPGQLLGVVAPDPATATALLDCLGRAVDPSGGVIEVDGVTLSTVDVDDARAAVLVAAHEAELFEGALVDNVAAVGDGEKVAAALTAAGADEVGRALPRGVDTVLTERGRSLSGGQRQRVALARALAADAPVLVLHDPTTAVDAVTEAAVADGLRRIREGRTTIVVTTSPALLAVADRVVVLADGAVRADGTHRSLVEDDGYRTAVLS
jgi:putative ABC transport system ATP-binding protein